MFVDVQYIRGVAQLRAGDCLRSVRFHSVPFQFVLAASFDPFYRTRLRYDHEKALSSLEQRPGEGDRKGDEEGALPLRPFESRFPRGAAEHDLAASGCVRSSSNPFRGGPNKPHGRTGGGDE